LKLTPSPTRPHPGPDVRVVTLEIEGEDLIVLSHPIDAYPSGLLDELTAAERQVLSLVLDGWSQSQIATERGTSPRTVAKQIECAYRRLGVGSKAALAALWASSLPVRPRP
jgi:DNA-binding NarL/FixJ family response regulator